MAGGGEKVEGATPRAGKRFCGFAANSGWDAEVRLVSATQK